MAHNKFTKILQEMFGDPMLPEDMIFGKKIGSYAGDPPYGAPSTDTCSSCGMMPEDPEASCECEEMLEGTSVCDECGMNEAVCECWDGGMSETRRRKGPSSKTAKKILRGTKTFGQKVKKVEKWADDPAAAAAWMTHKATGKWPSEK